MYSTAKKADRSHQRAVRHTPHAVLIAAPAELG